MFITLKQLVRFFFIAINSDSLLVNAFSQFVSKAVV